VGLHSWEREGGRDFQEILLECQKKEDSMDSFKTLALTCLVVAICACLQVEKTSASSVNAEALRNAVYQCEFAPTGSVRLINGAYQGDLSVGSSAELTVTLGEMITLGDLDDDGTEDAAVILIVDPGGSGTFYYLAAVVDEDGKPKNVTSTLLGDRVQVKSVSIRSGKIVVNMISQGPGDPMCCPSLEVTLRYVLQGEKLVEVRE
jgi:hypothetical protein